MPYISADMFTLNNKHYLCIVDYHNKFPIIKKTEDLSADSLILTCQIIYAEYRVPKKIISDSGGNFVSDKFRTFCKSLNIEQAFSSSCHHQSYGQVEACIKFVKYILRKCFDSKDDPHIALLQIHITLLGPEPHSPVIMLFNHLIRGKMPIFNSPLVGRDNDEEHYKALIKRQTRDDKNIGTPRNYVSIPMWSTVVAQQADGRLCTHSTVEGKTIINIMTDPITYESLEQVD